MEDKIAQEDLENLLSQLESFLGTKPICYLKFCSKEEYANSVLEGDLFSNTPRYFREKEKETGDRGQGDADELILALQTEIFWWSIMRQEIRFSHFLKVK